MRKKSAKSLPVAMYHYVNEWAGGITVSPECFEEHCRVLAEKGFRGVGLAEAEAFLRDGAPLPEKSLLITFDDGFFDNYLYAQPLLHKYGHKGVVFAVSGRLEKDGEPRLSVEAALAGGVEGFSEVAFPQATTPQGFAVRRDVFLNHAETRAMDSAGVLAVAAHSRGHYGVFTGPEYKDFFHPRSMSRTFYRTEEDMVFGMPDFPVKAGLLHRAFVPDPAMVEAIRSLVPQEFNAAAVFFAEPANVERLRALVGGFEGKMGRFETDEERMQRMRREIIGGKEELESILGHTVESLCWPWGRYCAEALSIAREAGFTVLFTTQEGVNLPGLPLAVHRFKAKDKSGGWMASRAGLYGRPLLGALYARCRV